MAFFDPHRVMGLCALALVACGGSSAPESVPTPDPPATFPEPRPAPPQKRGAVTMWSIDGAFVAGASFHDEFMDPAKAVSSPCHIYEPTRDERRSSENAGPIRIEVPTADGPHPMTLEFDEKSARYPVDVFEGLGGRADSPNQRIRIEAKGDSVPAFFAGIDSAADVEFAEPAKDFEIGPNTGDIKVRWSGNVNDEVFLSLDLLSASLTCKFAASDVGGIIPGALVQEVWKRYVAEKPTAEPCTADYCRSFFLASVRRTEISVGVHDVIVAHGLATLRPIRVTP